MNQVLSEYAYKKGSEVEVRFKLSDSGIQAGIVREYILYSDATGVSRTVSWEFLSGTGHRITKNNVATISASDIGVVIDSLKRGVYVHEIKTLIKSNVLNVFGIPCKVSESTEVCMGPVDYQEFVSRNPVNIFRHKNRETYFHSTLPLKTDITSVYTVTFEGNGNGKPKSRTEVEIEMLPGFEGCIQGVVEYIQKVTMLLSLPLKVLTKVNMSKISARAVYSTERVSGMILNNIITKPVSFMRKDLVTLYSSGYAVSYKADGIRCLVVNTKESIILITAFTFTVLPLSDHSYPDTVDSHPDIYDAELTGKTVYVFDAILDSDYPERTLKVLEFVSRVSCISQSYTFMTKDTVFPPIKGGVYTATQMTSLKKIPKDDGLIFTPTVGGYYSEIPVFKWKPADKNTIDLKVIYYRHRPQQRDITIGLSGPRVLPLDPVTAKRAQDFSKGHSRILITQLPLEDSISNLGVRVNDILECFFCEDLRAFIPMKKRGDKVIPNKWEVILDAIELVTDNVSVQEFAGSVISPPAREYATNCPEVSRKRETVKYSAVAYDLVNNYSDSGRNHESVMNSRIRMFHNYVKKALFDAYTVSRSNLRIADLCCGQGSAVKFSLANGNVSHLLLVDSSEKMLTEAMTRATQFNASGSAEITCSLSDLRTANVINANNGKYDIVECHFALQYFYETAEYLENIIRNVSGMLVPGGVFMGIMPDGDLLNTQLLKGDGIFEAHTADTEFKITAHYRSYASRGACAYDKKVSVFLKESILDTISDTGVCEYLASFPLLVSMCEKYNMTLTETAVLRHPYKIYQTGLKYKDPRTFSGIDKAFSFVYRYFVFTRNASVSIAIESRLSVNRDILPTPFGGIADRITVLPAKSRVSVCSVITLILNRRDPSVTDTLMAGLLLDYQCSLGLPVHKQLTDAQIITGVCLHFNCAVIILYQKKAARLHKQGYNERVGITGVIVLIETPKEGVSVVRCDNNDIWDPQAYPYKLT